MSERHKVVSHEAWLQACRSLLAREKEFTRLRDELSQARRELPWEAVTKDYSFEGESGAESLSELFAGRSQLVVYHFMFAPDWNAGCAHCSFWADNFNGIVAHLNQRDVALVAVSRAAYRKLAAYRARLGWSFKWVASGASSFNFNYQVSFTPEQLAKKRTMYNYAEQDPRVSDHAGISVFVKDETGRILHAYSTDARGLDIVNSAYHDLDLVPKGRDEATSGPSWVRRHDEYAG